MLIYSTKEILNKGKHTKSIIYPIWFLLKYICPTNTNDGSYTAIST